MEGNYEIERQEAIDAGKKALHNLRRALSDLEGARSWGVYDIIGGGLISSLVKHNRMDTARQHISEAKRSLHLFEKELRDLENLESINLDTQDFLGFADVIFDGILADVAMQRRINDARVSLLQTINRVEDILRNL